MSKPKMYYDFNLCPEVIAYICGDGQNYEQWESKLKLLSSNYQTFTNIFGKHTRYISSPRVIRIWDMVF